MSVTTKRTRLFGLIFFFISFLVYPQERKIDSLKSLLLSYTARDTVKLASLNELAYLYYGINPARGVEVAEQALVLAEELGHIDGMAKALSYKGHNYSVQGFDSLALSSYDAAIALRERRGDAKSMARLLYNKGLVYFNESDYNRANDNNHRAFEVFKAEKDSFLMAKMLNSIGINHMYLSQYPKALSSYLDAKLIYEDIGLTEDQQYAAILSNIGLLYARLENYELAGDYQKKALKLFEELDFEEGKANALTNLGRLQTASGNSKRAIDFYEEAFAIMQKNKNERGMASALTNMGIAYTELEQFTDAIPYFERTRSIYEKLKNTNNLAIVHRHLGDCFSSIANGSKMKLAEKNYLASIRYAEEAGSINLQFNAFDQLALLQTKEGDYKNAYKNKMTALVLRDSFASAEKKEEMALIEAKYEYDKEKARLQSDFEKKQAISNGEVARQKLRVTFLVIGAIMTVLFMAIAFLLYKKREKTISEKRISEFKTQVAETKLMALRSQINPHFIFNAMNSVSDYMAKNNLKIANDFLVKFSKLIRAILESSEKKWISLAEDLELTELYLQIEALRLKNKFVYSFHIADDIDKENTMVPPLILQPFIENSIWHGISKKETEGTIEIAVKMRDELLICSVEDNGVGRQRNTGSKNENTSMGLQITKNRLDIINQLKQGKGGIEMFDKEEGLRVEVKFPLELQF